ncbi:MAG TPA: protein kinase [Gemmataceae bacterium]|nr:protein kinase [Gemmataceae bacterium]
MPPAVCPGPDQLSAFVLGKLPDAAMQQLTAHTAGCARCQRELQARDAAADALILQIRRPRRAEATLEEPAMTRILRQAEVLTPQMSSESPPLGLAPAQASDELGRLGPYRVLRLIGVGGMGMVFEAEDPQLGRRVALKVMNPPRAGETAPRRRFLHEARAMGALSHDNIVPIYQAGEENGVLYLAMPILEGETLESRLERECRGEVTSPLPPAEALRIGREIAEGLAAAHATGLVHRDIKPANIWLEAGRDRVKILDFGLSRALESDVRLTQTGNVIGTPEYMSPEQAHCQPGDARSDLFSLGCVLYTAFTGVSPFHRDTEYSSLLAVATETPPSPRSLNGDVPPAAEELILQLMAKEPEQRPASARAVADTLAALLETPRPVEPSARPRRWIAWTAGAVLLAGVAGAAVVFAPQLLNVLKKSDMSATPSSEKAAAVTALGLPPGPVDEAFCKAVAALPPEKQLDAVSAKLKELNPGFDGWLNPTKDDAGAISRIEFTTDEVTNISPVRALPALTALHCTGSAPGKGKLTDLSQLHGLKLNILWITDNPVRDLSPLRDLPLRRLRVDVHPDLDLTPLREMKSLRYINEKQAGEFWAEHPPMSKPK